MEQRLRRAEAHAVRLAWNDRIMSLIPVQAKVGTVLRRTERPDEAEARYRQAIVAAGGLLEVGLAIGYTLWFPP